MVTRNLLETLESKNRRFYGTLKLWGRAEGYGAYWIDWENNAYYVWLTEAEHLSSKDLTDEQIGGIKAHNIK